MAKPAKAPRAAHRRHIRLSIIQQQQHTEKEHIGERFRCFVTTRQTRHECFPRQFAITAAAPATTTTSQVDHYQCGDIEDNQLVLVAQPSNSAETVSCARDKQLSAEAVPTIWFQQRERKILLFKRGLLGYFLLLLFRLECSRQHAKAGRVVRQAAAGHHPAPVQPNIRPRLVSERCDARRRHGQASGLAARALTRVPLARPRPRRPARQGGQVALLPSARVRTHVTTRLAHRPALRLQAGQECAQHLLPSARVGADERLGHCHCARSPRAAHLHAHERARACRRVPLALCASRGGRPAPIGRHAQSPHVPQRDGRVVVVGRAAGRLHQHQCGAAHARHSARAGALLAQERDERTLPVGASLSGRAVSLAARGLHAAVARGRAEVPRHGHRDESRRSSSSRTGTGYCQQQQQQPTAAAVSHRAEAQVGQDRVAERLLSGARRIEHAQQQRPHLSHEAGKSGSNSGWRRRSRQGHNDQEEEQEAAATTQRARERQEAHVRLTRLPLVGLLSARVPHRHHMRAQERGVADGPRQRQVRLRLLRWQRRRHEQQQHAVSRSRVRDARDERLFRVLQARAHGAADVRARARRGVSLPQAPHRVRQPRDRAARLPQQRHIRLSADCRQRQEDCRHARGKQQQQRRRRRLWCRPSAQCV